MATITGFTAERMLEIENASVVDGNIVGDNLILSRHDASTINAGNVRGPTGTPGVSSGDLSTQLADQITAINALIAIAMPIGSIVDYIGTTAPTNWLLMQGQTVVNAQTLYPVLWARLPAQLKSGSSLLMPDTRGRVPIGQHTGDARFDSIGEMGGEYAHQLSLAEMASHSHSINHDHAAQNTGYQSSNHGHDVGHNHGEVSTGPGSSHSHGTSNMYASEDDQMHYHGPAGGADQYAGSAPGGSYGFAAVAGDRALLSFGTTGYASVPHTHWIGGAMSAEDQHTHTVDLPHFVGTSGGVSADHYHGYDIDNFVGSSGSVGNDIAHNNIQPYIVFLKIIKAI